MRTVQMTLDDELVENIDRVAHALRTTRSALPGWRCRMP